MKNLKPTAHRTWGIYRKLSGLADISIWEFPYSIKFNAIPTITITTYMDLNLNFPNNTPVRLFIYEKYE